MMMIQRYFITTLLAAVFAGVALAQDGPMHTVEPGDTLYRIARTYGMSVEELKRLNDLTGDLIRVGEVLRLTADAEPEPVLATSVDGDAWMAEAETGPGFVKPADAEADNAEASRDDADASSAHAGPDSAEANPYDAGPNSAEANADDADRTSTAEAQLDDAVMRSAAEADPDDNDMNAAEANPDDFDADSGAATAEDVVYETLPGGRGVSTHVAEHGETLYSIAADRGTKAYILFALNEGLRSPLQPGTPVVVPASTRPAIYTVRRGDTLSKIAGTHGTTLAELRRANALNSDALGVGQTLTIPGAAAGDGPMRGGSQTFAVGSVTVFSETYAGQTMASDTAYEPSAFVVAHRELPFDTVLIVENAETGRASFARVADRAPIEKGRVLEISSALASEIGVDSGDRVRVRLVE